MRRVDDVKPRCAKAYARLAKPTIETQLVEMPEGRAIGLRPAIVYSVSGSEFLRQSTVPNRLPPSSV
jgi:hypothetical protein